MPPKKGGKKRGKTPIERAPVDRIPEYEDEIIRLNTELSEWRTKMDEIRQTNSSIYTEVKEVKQDREDINQYVERNLNDRIKESLQLRKDIAAIQRERVVVNKQYATEVAEKMAYYNKWDNILRSDGLMMTGNIMLCDKFRDERDTLMNRFDVLETDLRRQATNHSAEMYDAERDVLIDKYKLTCSGDEELATLLAAIKDTSQLRIMNKAELMIIENFELNNALDRLVNTYFKLEATVMMEVYDFKEARNSAELLQSENERLAFMIERHVDILEATDTRYEELLNEVAELHFKRNKAIWQENLMICAKEKIDQQIKDISQSEKHVKHLKVNIQNIKKSAQATEELIFLSGAVIETIKNFILSNFKDCKLLKLDEKKSLVNQSIEYFLNLIKTIPNLAEHYLMCCAPIDYGIEDSSDSETFKDWSKETLFLD